MPVDRYFLDGDLSASTAELLGEELRHVRRVMRKHVGDRIELVNGRGQLAKARIEAIDRSHATLSLSDLTSRPSPKPYFILAQAIPRSNRLTSIVEKATELGVGEFWFFPGTLSEKKELSRAHLKRVRSITIASMKQSGRLHLPQIHLKPALQEWKELPCDAVFGDLDPQAVPLGSLLPKDPLLIVIGPESGFTPQEEEKLRELGADGVSFHRNILRTDTAPLVALAIASQIWNLEATGF